LPWFAALQPVRRTIAASIQRDRRLAGPEAVMSDTLTQQHPAVVLRSHYRHVRALLAIALVAVVALSVTVVVLATRHQAPAAPVSAPASVGTTRYDGGPEEGTRGPAPAAAPVEPVGTRYDGGPDEGTRGPGH
jgi:hypothetical protein